MGWRKGKRCCHGRAVIQYTLREITLGDRAEVVGLLTEAWGGVEVVALGIGGLVDASALPGWLAELDGRVAGLLTYQLRDGAAEIVTINVVEPGQGIGTALLAELARAMRDRGVDRLRVTTTNDNLDALRFYQRNGFRLVELRPGAIARARRVKPSIPETGQHGIAIRDELDLERTV